MILTLGMEQQGLVVYKPYVKDNLWQTLSNLTAMSNVAIVCANIRPKYQVTRIYRTIGLLVINTITLRQNVFINIYVTKMNSSDIIYISVQDLSKFYEICYINNRFVFEVYGFEVRFHLFIRTMQLITEQPHD